MAKTPFEAEIDRIAERHARKVMKERPGLMLTHEEACDITRGTARAVKDEWPRLAALRVTWPPGRSPGKPRPV
jgi:hypothetical protein